MEKKDFNRYFNYRGWIASKYMKRCTTSLVISEIQIKTTMRYHYTLIRMVSKNKTYNTKCWLGCRAILIYCWWGCKILQKLWKQFGSFHEVTHLPCDQIIPLLGVYPREKYIVHTKTCIWIFIIDVFIIAKTWK